MMSRLKFIASALNEAGVVLEGASNIEIKY